MLPTNCPVLRKQNAEYDISTSKRNLIRQIKNIKKNASSKL